MVNFSCCRLATKPSLLAMKIVAMEMPNVAPFVMSGGAQRQCRMDAFCYVCACFHLMICRVSSDLMSVSPNWHVNSGACCCSFAFIIWVWALLCRRVHGNFQNVAVFVPLVGCSQMPEGRLLSNRNESSWSWAFLKLELQSSYCHLVQLIDFILLTCTTMWE